MLLDTTEPEHYSHFAFFKVLEQFSLSCSKITWRFSDFSLLHTSDSYICTVSYPLALLALAQSLLKKKKKRIYFNTQFIRKKKVFCFHTNICSIVCLGFVALAVSCPVGKLGF